MGQTNSDEGIATSGAYQEDFMSSGASDNFKLFLGKINANNELEWATYFGNYANVYGSDLHLHNGQLILTGFATLPGSLPEEMQIPFSTPNAFQPEIAGELDAFFAVFDGVTGVEIRKDESRFSVYPNPALDVLNLSFPYRDNWRLEVFNAQGQLVQSENVAQQEARTIPIQHLSSGVYQLRCTSGAGDVLHQQVVVR